MSVSEETYKKNPMVFLMGAFIGACFTCAGAWILVTTFYMPKISDLEKSVSDLKQQVNVQLNSTTTKPEPINPALAAAPTMTDAKRKNIIKQLDTEIAAKELQRVGLSPLMANEPPSAAYNRLINEIDTLNAKRLDLFLESS